MRFSLCRQALGPDTISPSVTWVSVLTAIAFLLASCGSVRFEPPGAGLQRGGWSDRYLTYDGDFEYYVGFDVQQLHADTGIDFRQKLDFLRSYDINKIRIWLFPSFLGLPGDRNYPASGKILHPWKVDSDSGKFDLDAWDPEFWNRTQEFLKYARRQGFIVEVSLFSIQEPRNYFRDPGVSYPFYHEDNLQGFGRPTDPDGRFMNGFFDLEYRENGVLLADYHRAYIDKALHELDEFDHIYYEIMNESPGELKWVNNDLPHSWMQYWLNYIGARTSRLVTAHVSGFMNLDKNTKRKWSDSDLEEVGARYLPDPYLDGFNFHLYSDNPSLISNALTAYQNKGLLLVCNEGDAYYEIDRSQGYPNYRLAYDEDRLYGEIRHAWGMFTAAGYYSIYFGPVPQLGDRSSIEGARTMQAMRSIVESTNFYRMRPVRDDGSEIDDLVESGPTENWQVIANIDQEYLVYFWGPKSDQNVLINLLEGTFRYSWMDPREKRDPIKSGYVTVTPGITAEVSTPMSDAWNEHAGIVLVISRSSQTSDQLNRQSMARSRLLPIQ